jgi:hypothetical protein
MNGGITAEKNGKHVEGRGHSIRSVSWHLPGVTDKNEKICQVEDEVISRPTVSWPVRLGVWPLLGHMTRF